MLQSMRSQSWTQLSNWTTARKTRYLKFRNLAPFYVWEDARSGLPEIIPCIFTSAIWGQDPAVFTSPLPQILGDCCREQVQLNGGRIAGIVLLWAGIADCCDFLVY